MVTVVEAALRAVSFFGSAFSDSDLPVDERDMLKIKVRTCSRSAN